MTRTPYDPDSASGKTGLPAVCAPDARLLILGSLPGDRSIAQAQYYAHPRNQFWTLMSMVVDVPLVQMPYPDRLDALLRNRIGLWDVIQSAARSGSLDSAMRGITVNPLQEAIARLPDLRAVAFNGGTASQQGRRLLQGVPHISLISLPSSSAAYTASLDSKCAAWSVLRTFL